MSACAGSRPEPLSLPQAIVPRSWNRNQLVLGLSNRRKAIATSCAACVSRESIGSVCLRSPAEAKHQTDACSVFLRERRLKIDVVEIDHQC